MTKKEVKELLPKDKFDNYHIETLYELSNKELNYILPELLIWIKDVNMPVSKELVNVLSTREEILRPLINTILIDPKEDSIWKYNLINKLLTNFKQEDLNFYKESLERIVNEPTKNEIDRETHDLAKDIFNLIK